MMLASPNPDPNLKRRQKGPPPKPSLSQRSVQKRLKTRVKQRVKRKISDAATMGFAKIAGQCRLFCALGLIKSATGIYG